MKPTETKASRSEILERLRTSTILVKLTTRNWTGARVDNKATASVIAAHNALPAAGKFVKHLVSAQHRKRLQTAIQLARRTHRSMTLPWDDDAQRLLPMASFERYKAKMAEAEEAILSARRSFVDRWDDMRDEARRNLGTLFDASQYPSKEALVDRIGLDIVYTPVPQAEHLVVDAADEIVDTMRSGIEEDTLQRVSDGVAEMHQRLADALRAVCARLDTDAEGKPLIFRDSLIGNLVAALEFAADGDLTDDERLQTVVDRMREAVGGVKPDELRPGNEAFDPAKRDRVKAASAEVLGDFYGALGAGE